MTTTMESLNWDTYISDDPHSKAGLERFRRSVWPRLRRQLALELLWEVPDGAEPHWFDAGTARFWHQLVSPRGDQGPWELTSPSLPILLVRSPIIWRKDSVCGLRITALRPVALSPPKSPWLHLLHRLNPSIGATGTVITTMVLRPGRRTWPIAAR